MSLSKECGQVSSTSSGFPVVLPANGSDLDDSDLGRFNRKYLQDATDKVDSLFAELAGLERQQALKLIELEIAMAAQVEAQSNMPDFPDLSAVTLWNAVNLDLELELDVNPQPPANIQNVTTFAAWSTTPTAIAASAAVLAAASTRRPTILVPRAPRPVPGLLPVKPAMKSSTRPAGRKPSKGDTPTTSADSALLNTTT